MNKLYIDIEVPSGVDADELTDAIWSHMSRVSWIAELLGGRAITVSHIGKLPSPAAVDHLKKLSAGEEAA